MVSGCWVGTWSYALFLPLSDVVFYDVYCYQSAYSSDYAKGLFLVRKLVGPTEPKSAPPGTIRGDFSHMSFVYGDVANKGIPNLIHASGDDDEAEQEIAHWFSESELYDYQLLSEKFTR